LILIFFKFSGPTCVTKIKYLPDTSYLIQTMIMVSPFTLNWIQFKNHMLNLLTNWN
jgi:hypothetical protein